MFNVQSTCSSGGAVSSRQEMTETLSPGVPAVAKFSEKLRSPEGRGATPGLGEEPMLPLGLLSPLEKAVIVAVRSGKPSCGSACPRQLALSRLEELGLRRGKTIEVLNNHGCGLILIKVDESRIALGRGAALKIMVRRVCP